ncbi:helix-turn-helix transcriptional regulator [Paenibacillus ginsengarvi]|uniref:Helix-turn-helix domain-containing protein n=1 Tax=Paenibacillus ginsengarvi TaxID=400777 RepID=A0A3B0B1H7_9BACL|nr:AraC family transcriptional regulator [Paenibacillus ginsengarvi]RKN66049.1 helix-turn-helix domain-containing protein [Paenibacillus ginsengarvi]
MTNPQIQTTPVAWDQLNIKVRFGSLLFDILLDGNIYPMKIVSNKKHNHAVIEMQFIDSGIGTLVMKDREHHLESGSIHIIGQHIFHSFKPDPIVPGERSTIRFTFQEVPTLDPGFPQEEAEQIKAALSRLTYCQLTDSIRNRAMFRMLAEIRSEIESPSVGSYTKVLSLFAQIIIELVRAIQTERNTSGTYTMPHKERYDQWSPQIDLFFTNCQQELTLEMLAARLNLSTKQTQRLLKKYFNTSFKDKLMNTRVEVAKDLLRTSGLSIERIAGDVGYSSTQYFCYLFQQKTGMTPSDYRSLELSGNTAQSST